MEYYITTRQMDTWDTILQPDKKQHEILYYNQTNGYMRYHITTRQMDTWDIILQPDKK
jgi:hypothetical protein